MAAVCIAPEHRWFHPIDWRELSLVIRFTLAKGRGEHCGRPHGHEVTHLGDRTWWDAERTMGTDAHGVNEILDRLHETAEGESKVSIGDIVDALGDRGYGPLLFVPALIDISPIGGIPTLPSILALIMALMAVQIIFGREKMWLPGFLRRLSVKGERMTKATDKLRPVARWLDRWFHSRLKWLTSRWVIRVAAVLIVFLCLSVPPLELLPFATTVPMAAIASFGLALTLRDGLLMCLGFLISAVTVVVGFGLLGG